ncbi:hypothetical protein TSUD_413720 [Trifolium subterraneum]|uniref:Reverse transcriptase Ty1/copia-type domain-containing protein n=1 Tax=Trifolium subterraneum TaxID=3900 RepID=A0A1B5Z7C2_TRISU|nr:hypothetical protein TSUD_413720 [Trifolium subterraneum]
MASSLENLTNSFGGKLSILDNSNNWDRWSKQMKKIENATSTKECWDILEKGHSGNDKLKHVRLTTWKRQFELLQMDENESIVDYFNKITNITNQMKSCGSTVSDGDMVEKVIETLSSKFDYITVATMEAKYVSTMKLEELQCSLESHEQRINAREKNRTIDQALWAHTSKKRNGNKNKGKGQVKKENSQQESSKKNDDQGESSKSDGNGKEANMAQDDSGSETDAFLMMTITDDDDDEKEQWKWDTESTDSQSTIPFIFEEDNDGTDTAQVTAEIEPEVRLYMLQNMLKPMLKNMLKKMLKNMSKHMLKEMLKHISEVHLELFVDMEPLSYASAAKSMEETMEDEIQSIERKNTWELVSIPTCKKSIAVKWVYKVKHKPDGIIAKYKARLVAKEFLQKPGIDFNEIFVPVARLETVRLIVAIANHFEWDYVPLDVKSAFLNGKLEEEVYVEQPQGFIVEGKEDHVLKMNKALYGLKQAPS